MNFKATLSDITITFTPDEGEKAKRLIDFGVEHVEEINRNGINEDFTKLPQKFAQIPLKEKHSWSHVIHGKGESVCLRCGIPKSSITL